MLALQQGRVLHSDFGPCLGYSLAGVRQVNMSPLNKYADYHLICFPEPVQPRSSLEIFVAEETEDVVSFAIHISCLCELRTYKHYRLRDCIRL